MTEKEDKQISLMKQAAGIAKRAQIHGIALSDARVRRRVGDLPDSIRLTYGFRDKYSFEPESKELSVLVQFMLGASPSDVPDENADACFRLEAAFSLRYEMSGDEPCDDDQLKAFARMNGIYNAWPYWREYVQSTVSRMGLAPVTVPLLTGQAIERMIRDQEASSEESVEESNSESR
ncbi:MAG TPA: hypothetical protein VG826_04120 [Pirellulales bacterium]|nr:hypothetical protein [Pirellulales bacterium]